MDTLSATATATATATSLSTFATTPRARLHHPFFKTTTHHLPPPHHSHPIPASAKLSNKPKPTPLINNPSQSQTPNSKPKQPPTKSPPPAMPSHSSTPPVAATRFRQSTETSRGSPAASATTNRGAAIICMSAATEACVLREVARKGKLEKHVVKLVELLIKKSKVDILGEVLLEFGKIYDQLLLDSKRSQLVMVSPGVRMEKSQLLGIAKSVQKLTGAEEVSVRQLADKRLPSFAA